MIGFEVPHLFPVNTRVTAESIPLHRGRTTQVWDAVVTHKDSGRRLAMFRCTQLVLYS